jgi:hypothetical protein
MPAFIIFNLNSVKKMNAKRSAIRITPEKIVRLIGAKTDIIPARADNIRNPKKKYSSRLSSFQPLLPFSRILTSLDAVNPQTIIARKTIIQINKTRSIT